MTVFLVLLLAVFLRLRLAIWAVACLLGSLAWLLRPTYWLGLLGVLSLGLSLLVATSSPVHAGWWWGPDPKVEAANQALERAAELATEAARTQSKQQESFLAAVSALANERTQLAGHLTQLSELARQDSAWASALSTSGPVLVSVAALSLAGLAIWLTTRAGSHDAELASVLVDELSGSSSSSSPLLLSQHAQVQLRALNNPRHNSASNTPEEEMPF